jgi:hypothetical protein
MNTVKEDIDIIMQQPTDDIIRQILTKMDDWKVSHIRQSFKSSWKDNIHQSLFDLWYRHDDWKSPARDWFIFNRQYTKSYPEQGWAPESEGLVNEYRCNLCGEIVDDDDILLDHFRNRHCCVFDDMVRDIKDKIDFWHKMNQRKNK